MAEAPPPDFEFTQNNKMADDEENNKKRFVFVVIIKGNKTETVRKYHYCYYFYEL